jgi:putative glycosyltransferase (TIGR04348 family)
MLSSWYSVRIVRAWPDDDADRDRAMIALHARRSAASIDAWSRTHPGRGLAVVLTGTDLYRDIIDDPLAKRSLKLAQRLVVLQEKGIDAVPAVYRSIARTILQSAPRRNALSKTTRRLRAVMVGHLREEKSPQTLFDAAALLAGDSGILIDHIGAALDPALAKRARKVALQFPSYRWLGEKSHESTRRHIQRAHVLVQTSRIEGGANALIEAVRSGTPVIASRIPGNVGVLGEDYPGYFPWDESVRLAELLRSCLASARNGGGLLAKLQARCRKIEGRFEPESEAARLRDLAADLLATSVR